jgi:pimeloyl-ACP methyl ester carboxylesterase
MKYYELGKQHEKTIMLLPGTCCNVKSNFSQVIPLLAKHYHVIGVDYDGFDGKGTEFPDMLTVTRKIERFIAKMLRGSVHIVYGSSLGGSFVGLLVQRNRIHIDHAVIGSSDLDQSGKVSAWLQTQLLGGAFYQMLKKGQMPKWMIKISEKKMGKEATQKYTAMISGISDAMQTVSKKSMKQQFYSDLVTPLGEKIKANDTTVHIFYALQMGEKYRDRYRLHFADPDMIEQDYGHEELLFFYPEEWVKEIRKCCEKG